MSREQESTYSMIRSQVVYLLVPDRSPHILAQKLDNIQRIREPPALST